MENISHDPKTKHRSHPSRIVASLIVSVIALQLSACGGGGGGSGGGSTASGAGTDIVSSADINPADSGTSSSATNSGNSTSTKSTSTLTLSWAAPVTRADGTPLSLAEVDGFNIYYGNSAGNYTNHINVDDATAQTITLTNVPVGTYYLVMTTYDVNGLESTYSMMVKKTVS